MADEHDQIRGRFIHEVGEFAAGLGLNRSVGELYGLLYMSPRALCLDEMAEAAQMSKASASVNVRELERWGAVRKTWVQGDRKDYYEANRNLPEIVIGRMQDGLGRRLRGLRGAIAEAQKAVDAMPADSSEKAFYGERLAELRRLEDSVQRALNNLDKIYLMAKRFFL